MRWSRSAARAAESTPARVVSVAVWMRSAVSRAASALRRASERTSSATTENPTPASPARAASTAALSANKFVWKAISSMVPRIRATSPLRSSINRIVAVSACISSEPAPAACRASHVS